MTNESLHVAVVDIGNLKNLGWVVEGPAISNSGTNIDRCIEALGSAMKTGPLALGFEAPMFVPYGKEATKLDDARAMAMEIVRSQPRPGRVCSPRRW